MRLCLPLLLLIGGVAVADDMSDEAKKLEGTWLIESVTLDGKAVDNTKGGQIVIAGDKLTMKHKNGKEQPFTFTVDPAKKPKTMDLDLPEGHAQSVIYDLDGDALKLVVGEPDKRPTEFTDKGNHLIMLKRKK
jgi:uncharacterized protein (TIGR03067 family)